MFPLYSDNGPIGFNNRTPTKGLEANFSILVGMNVFGCLQQERFAQKAK